MFQALGRDRLERLNASPSATPWTYFRVYSVLLFVLSVDLFWYCLTFFFENYLLFSVLELHGLCVCFITFCNNLVNLEDTYVQITKIACDTR